MKYKILFLLIFIFTSMHALAYSGSESGYSVNLVTQQEMSGSSQEAYYEMNFIANPATSGYLSTEGNYDIGLNIYTGGVGGERSEQGYRLYLVPEQAFISYSSGITANDPVPDTVPPSDALPPNVTDAAANQSDIPDDTDSVPLWGETAQLNVTVTDASNVSVTVNLSEIGGSLAQQMILTGGNTYTFSAATVILTGGSTYTYSAITNASAGTPPKLYNLTVNATDVFGNSNTSAAIQLRVRMNGDTTGDDRRNIGDALRLANNVSYPGDTRYPLSSIYVSEVTGDGRITIGDALRLANNVSYPGDPRYVLK